MVMSTLAIRTEELRTTNAAQRWPRDMVTGRVTSLTDSLKLGGRQGARVEGHFVASVPLNPLDSALAAKMFRRVILLCTVWFRSRLPFDDGRVEQGSHTNSAICISSTNQSCAPEEAPGIATKCRSSTLSEHHGQGSSTCDGWPSIAGHPAGPSVHARKHGTPPEGTVRCKRDHHASFVDCVLKPSVGAAHIQLLFGGPPRAELAPHAIAEAGKKEMPAECTGRTEAPCISSVLLVVKDMEQSRSDHGIEPVSYTHLTLPTK